MAYANFEVRKINFACLQLAGCLEEIIKVHGNNNYHIPHIGKERLERAYLFGLKASEVTIEIAKRFFFDEVGGSC